MPTAISADRSKKELTVSWSDGQSCIYPFALLREACPCATCRGEDGEKAEEDPLALPVINTRATMIRKVELVGNYALNIEWEDGHHYGIYNWAYLRSLCGDQRSD